MADRSIKWPVGILHNMLVKLVDFIIPADFVVLDCDVDFEVPIILGRSLLATGRVIVDTELNEFKFRLGKKEAKFKMHQPMTQQKYMSVFLIVDIFYDDRKWVLTLYWQSLSSQDNPVVRNSKSSAIGSKPKFFMFKQVFLFFYFTIRI